MGRNSLWGLALALLAGCNSGVPFTCPDGGTTARYEDVGRPFLEANCNWCHAAGVQSRQGAPTEITFDTLDEVIRQRERILIRATGDRPSMPPGPVKPDAADRARFGVWLACAPP